MQLVDNDTFLKELAALFERSKAQGSIWLTHKRLTHDDEGDKAMKPAENVEDDKEYQCLVRVSYRGKEKFSTRVHPSDLHTFHATYGALLKSSMTTLRKRDKKREKQRAEAAAAHKKKLSETVQIDGPKRGKGRRKRQRQIKAAIKRDEALKAVEQRQKEREEKRKQAEVGV
ncbi:signal recognition particle, SRP9/SRP14 subunit [Dendrothele bispora CBS 962.96]|uniref:Signal recognition particle subunit SRP14 n=1 Tax=Dendrothele bispora (strain CBS 962.96) TaxID=1314807 RepID=A0A4S8LTI0_DENBC|nr:signal recognition particle, SRP9/SRP14 subunit [Dendrothele bispora CBS 962.96]